MGGWMGGDGDEVVGGAVGWWGEQGENRYAVA